MQGWGGGGSDRVVLIDNGRVNQSKAADALVQVKTTKFGTNVGLNMLLNISSRYFWGLFWSRQLRGLPSSDGNFFRILIGGLFYYRQWRDLSSSDCYFSILTQLLMLPISDRTSNFNFHLSHMSENIIVMCVYNFKQNVTLDVLYIFITPK